MLPPFRIVKNSADVVTHFTMNDARIRGTLSQPGIHVGGETKMEKAEEVQRKTNNYLFLIENLKSKI